MPGTSMFIAAVAFAAMIAQPLAALAQEKPCPDFACRAIYPFKTCDRPFDGAKTLTARVIAVSRDRCSGEFLSMEVENPMANNLPPVIEIDLGHCTDYAGKVGDTIQIAMRQPHSPDVRRYNLTCKRW
jgi:hypothetical protein